MDFRDHHIGQTAQHIGQIFLGFDSMTEKVSVSLIRINRNAVRCHLKNRANLRHVQEILGHEKLTSTECYLRLTITDLKEAHQRFHPREKQIP